MASQSIYQVDAFTSVLFRGNPAAVCPVERWPDAGLMQAVAEENNLSETAFFSREGARDGADFHLRWFTPRVEVELCGHATLASAHVLFGHLGFEGDRVRFSTERAGVLAAARVGEGRVSIELPARGRDRVEPVSPQVVSALERAPAELYRSGYNLLAVFESKRDVHELRPRAEKLGELDAFGVIVTAPGAGHDFVSRYFAPGAGVFEDPVTGSAHCTLAPYWADRLGKRELTAHQVSRRGGELACELDGDHVRLTGGAVTYLEGHIRIGE